MPTPAHDPAADIAEWDHRDHYNAPSQGLRVPLTPEQQRLYNEVYSYRPIKVITPEGKRFTIVAHYPEMGVRWYDAVAPDGTYLRKGLILAHWELQGWLSGLQPAPEDEEPPHVEPL